MSGGVVGEVQAAIAALERAQSALGDEEREQEARVEAAEFGPHGHSDLIQAESQRLDRLRELREQLESAGADLRAAARDLGDVL